MQKIIIYGFGMSRHNRLIKPDDVVWSLNDYWNNPQELQFKKHPVKPSIVFQIHDDFADDKNRFTEWKKHYEIDNCNVIVSKLCGLKNEELFDFERFDRELRIEGFKLVGGISFMLAHAYMQGVKEIELMGIDFTDRREYTRQMPETLNAIKILRKKGIKIIAPQEHNWNDRSRKIDWSTVQEISMDYNRDLSNHIWVNA